MLMRLHLSRPNALTNENVVPETLLKTQIFPSLPSMGNIVATQKMFLINIVFDRDMVVSITMHLQVAAL